MTPSILSADPQAASGYTRQQLADIVGVSVKDVGKWVGRGLLAPAAGRDCFDFQQLSRAQTLRDLIASGVSLKKLRDAMARLSSMNSSTAASVLCSDGKVFARLQDGELINPAGQIHIDFAPPGQPLALSPPQSKSRAEWYECGVAHEAEGTLSLAIACYREALLGGGPDKDICFALAHALAATGETARAAERYFQVVELDPQNADAWNNLGVSLSDLNRYDEACKAFRHVLKCRPDDAGAHYNLADALDEAGNPAAAVQHWQAYLRADRLSERAAYARQRLAAAS